MASTTENYNKNVRSWNQVTTRKMKKEILRMTAVYSGQAQRAPKSQVRTYMGEASRISWAFPYYMVFVHKGAGRGYGGSKTGLFTRADGRKGKTNKLSMGRMGTGRRQAKPWFNPIVEERFPELAAIIAQYHAGKVLANMEKILIR